MDPIVSPTDPTQMGTANAVRQPFGTPKAGVLAPTGIPQTDKWLEDWQMRNFGRLIDQGDRSLIDTISQVMNGRPLLRQQAWRSPELNIHERPPQEQDYDPVLALKHGFESSTIGALRRWSAIDGPIMMKDDPNYDVFGDRQIKDSPFKDRMHLFLGSGSERETAWRIQTLSAREKDGRALERMGGGGIFEAAGGMLGDPLNFIPATLGVRAATLAARTTLLTAPETVAIGFKPVVWGGITDGARAAAAQAGVAMVDAGVHSALDPSNTNGSIADIVTLPGAIAAGVGFLTGAHGRFLLGSDALARAAGNHDFLAGTRARASGEPAGGPRPGQGLPPEQERAYWEKAAAANPAGRFHVDGRVLGWEDDNVVFRTAEGLDTRIPARDVDVVSEKSARGLVVSSDRLVSDPALMGSAMKLDGEFLGGGIPRLFRQGDDVVRPGTLHTDYTAMRAEEMSRSATLRDTGTVPEPRVARTIPNEDHRGEFVLETTAGEKLRARELPVGTRIAAEDGGMFEVQHSAVAEEEPFFRRVAWGERKPAGSRLVDKEFKPGELEDVEIAKGGGSLSAGGVGTAASRRKQLIGNRLAATGIGLEKLPFDVVNRAAALPLTTWQTTVEDLLSSGGRVRVKNTRGSFHEPTALPVEILIRTQWTKPAIDVVRALRDEWQTFRSGAAVADPTDFQRIGFEVRTTIADRFAKGPAGMPFEQFRRRVGDALINGDQDLLSDAATPQINAAASRTRQLLERIKREGTDVGLFKEAHEEQLRAAEAKVAGLKKAGAPPDELAAAERRVDHIKDLAGDLIAGGPKVNTAKSYRPRFWLVDQLRDRADEFKQIVDDWLRLKDPTLSASRRKEIAVDIHETLLRDKPVWTKEDVKQQFKDLAEPGSAKARTFTIPDMLVKDFLENDAEVIVRQHSRTMGTAIEMHRRFGSTGMEAEAEEIQNEGRLLVAAAKTNEEKKKLIKQTQLALADMQASRDRLYGVYGAPDDPHRWSSRVVRMAKQFTNLTTLGMSGVTAMGDLIRPVMTEGLQAVHDYGFRTLASDVRGQILRMSRDQLELAGDGMELINNTRALSMSDAGDAFRSRTPFERGLAKTNSWFFVMNGLNWANQVDKEWAGVIIQGNVNAAIQKLYAGGKLEPWMMTRLAANGIDESMARRIGSQFLSGPSHARGSNRFGKLVLADTENWTDEEAAKAYRVALNQMVNRTVPTPTLADTPNWMSSELGSLMTQYKSFAFGALNRSLVSGLQEETRQFWYGAAMAVGFGVILNEIRSRLFYDRSTFDKPMTGVLMDAVDRSSILGYFSDANRSIEVLTGHRAGIRPFVGADSPREESGSRTVGSVAGPFAGQAVNALSVLGDFMAMHPTVKTMADARQLIPGQNLPYLDPAFDHLISDGNRWKKPVNGRQERAGK